MKAGYKYGLFALLIVAAIAGYLLLQRDTGLDTVTGQVVRDQANAAANDVNQEIAQLATEEKSGNVCDGFGFVRTKVNPDGSTEEYCYDPCDGNQDCIANWDDVEDDVPVAENINIVAETTIQPSVVSTGSGQEKRKKG